MQRAKKIVDESHAVSEVGHWHAFVVAVQSPLLLDAFDAERVDSVGDDAEGSIPWHVSAPRYQQRDDDCAWIALSCEAFHRMDVLVYLVGTLTPSVWEFLEAAEGGFFPISHEPTPGEMDDVARRISQSMSNRLTTAGRTQPLVPSPALTTI